MIFKVTPNEIFFTIPTLEELLKAEDKVAHLCRERLSTIWKEDPMTRQKVSAWLNIELERMRATRTAFHFLMLCEIVSYSREKGYPVVALGKLSGSVISYLLSITGRAPFEYYTPETVWGLDANPISPDCTIGIAPQVRPLLQKHLDSCYGFTDCNREMFRQIPLVDLDICVQLGVLLQDIKKYPTVGDIDHIVCFHVAMDILTEFAKEHGLDVSTIEEFCRSKTWDLHALSRLYAFTMGGFNDGSNLACLDDPKFFVTREEFYHYLLQYNIPVDVALEITKNGVWATGSKRQKYNATLVSYHVPEFVMNYYSQVYNLWTMASCVDRVLHKCYLVLLRNALDKDGANSAVHIFGTATNHASE